MLRDIAHGSRLTPLSLFYGQLILRDGICEKGRGRRRGSGDLERDGACCDCCGARRAKDACSRLIVHMKDPKASRHQVQGRFKDVFWKVRAESSMG